MEASPMDAMIEQRQNGEATDKDTLMLMSGIALVVFGAGLILSNRSVRKYVGQVGPGGLLQAAVPDVERYMKLRAM
ncbi:MAG TPA: hypothetical protein VL287_00905 [Gemmatimonadales bacterium]|nr:hypothetical protein [Gemmatimonadales bacterium]